MGETSLNVPQTCILAGLPLVQEEHYRKAMIAELIDRGHSPKHGAKQERLAQPWVHWQLAQQLAQWSQGL